MPYRPMDDAARRKLEHQLLHELYRPLDLPGVVEIPPGADAVTRHLLAHYPPDPPATAGSGDPEETP